MPDSDDDQVGPTEYSKVGRAGANSKGMIVRTEGQRLLAKVPLSISGLAASIGGASRASVCHWRNGVKTPSAEFRAKLYAAHDIPVEAWFELPNEQAHPDPAIPDSSPPASPSTVPSPAPPLLAPPVPPPFPRSPSTVPTPPAAAPSKASKFRAAPANDNDRVPTAKEDCLNLLASLRGSLAKPNLVQSERSRLNADFNRALTLRRRLELDEELAEDRIVREHPTWALIRRGISRALVPYPNAAQAVAAVLSELEI